MNQTFQRRLVPLVRPDDVVWVHDYHLMMLPRLVSAPAWEACAAAVVVAQLTPPGPNTQPHPTHRTLPSPLAPRPRPGAGRRPQG